MVVGLFGEEGCVFGVCYLFLLDFEVVVVDGDIDGDVFDV